MIDGNRLGFMFICNPSPGVFDNQQDVLAEMFKMDFPTDTVCQISLTALPDLTLQLSAWSAVRGGRMTGNDKLKADLLNGYQLDYYDRSMHKPLKPDHDNLMLRIFRYGSRYRFLYSLPFLPSWNIRVSIHFTLNL